MLPQLSRWAVPLVAIVVSFQGLGDSAFGTYMWSAAVDKVLVVIPENGVEDAVHYTFTNSGTDSIWIFTFALTASQPVFPDPTDKAETEYFGKNFSLGVEVKPGGTEEFGYKITPANEIELPPDFGIQLFSPAIDTQLRTGPKITDPALPSDAVGVAASFLVIVYDIPEPATLTIILPCALFWARRRSHP
jgi:hypothetical protein